jgi:hypothetical protein
MGHADTQRIVTVGVQQLCAADPRCRFLDQAHFHQKLGGARGNLMVTPIRSHCACGPQDGISQLAIPRRHPPRPEVTEGVARHDLAHPGIELQRFVKTLRNQQLESITCHQVAIQWIDL